MNSQVRHSAIGVYAEKPNELGTISCTNLDNNIDNELCSFVSKPPNHVQYNSIYYCLDCMLEFPFIYH